MALCVIFVAVVIVAVYLAVRYGNFFYNLLPAFLFALFDPGKLKVLVSMLQVSRSDDRTC